MNSNIYADIRYKEANDNLKKGALSSTETTSAVSSVLVEVFLQEMVIIRSAKKA